MIIAGTLGFFLYNAKAKLGTYLSNSKAWLKNSLAYQSNVFKLTGVANTDHFLNFWLIKEFTSNIHVPKPVNTMVALRENIVTLLKLV